MQQWLSRVYALKRVGQSLSELHASCDPSWRVLSMWFDSVACAIVCVCACARVCVCVTCDSQLAYHARPLNLGEAWQGGCMADRTGDRLWNIFSVLWKRVSSVIIIQQRNTLYKASHNESDKQAWWLLCVCGGVARGVPRERQQSQ